MYNNDSSWEDVLETTKMRSITQIAQKVVGLMIVFLRVISMLIKCLIE